MTLDNWLLYLAAVTLLALTPGPNGLLALTHGARFGARSSCCTILGGATGFMLLMLVSILGLGSLLLTSATAFALLKLFGAGYLVYLGVRQWRAPPLQRVDTATSKDRLSATRRAVEGFTVAIANPKVILFFMAFLPQFIDTQQPLTGQFLILATTFALVEITVELLLAISAARILGWFSHRRGMQLFNRATGALFMAAGGFLAFSQR